MDEKSALFVLGMHRSGTSLMAGCLAELGVDFGSDMVPAREGVNEKGFFEHRQILEVHDRLLGLLESDWMDPCPLPENWQASATAITEQRRLQAILHRDLHSRLIGIKDPRLARLLPLWIDLMSHEQRAPAAIIVLRKPSEIAASLQKRDHLSEERSLLVWLNQMLATEEVTRGLPRLFINFDDILANPTTTCIRIADQLDIQFPMSPEQGRERLDAFATDGLRHHRSESAEHPMVEQAWGIFQKVAADPSFSPAESLQNLRDSTDHSNTLFGATHREMAREIQELRQAFRDSMAALEHRDRQLNEVNAGFQTAIDSLHELGFFNEASPPEPEPPTDPPPIEISSDLEEKLAETERRENETPDLTYKGAIDFSIENNSHTIAFRFLTEASHGKPCRVLEAGCASGYFGRAVRDFGHEVWGVETDAEAAGLAATALDNVFVGTIEAFLDAEERPPAFDFVTFGDVLEHLADPVTILRQTHSLLGPDGCVIASIPNVAHLAVRSMLLEGRFEYSKLGIMDDTHLRFFTRDSILELFAKAGFAVERIATTVLPVSATGIPTSTATTAAAAAACVDDETEVFQFVVRARPVKTDTPTALPPTLRAGAGKRILALPPVAESTLVDVRIRQPLRAWSEQLGGHFRCGNLTIPLAEDIQWAEIVVLQREANETTLGLIRQLQQAGKKVVFDIDDLLTEIPDYLLSAQATGERRQLLEQTLTCVDAVTVATEPLRDAYRELNPNIFVVPNTSSALPPMPARDLHDSRIPLVVASSDTVRVDFITECLREVQDAIGNRIRLIGIGPPGEYLAAKGLDIERHKNLGYEDFRFFLQGLPGAIGLIPLDDSRFNSCKSAIKFLDYAQAGIVSICSNVLPYTQVVEDGRTGRLAPNETAAWKQAIFDLVENPAQREAFALAAHQVANEELGSQRAAVAWQSLIEHLEPYPPRASAAFVPPDEIGSLEASNKVLRVIDKVREIAIRLQDPQRAVKLRRIWKHEGMSGLGRRLLGRSRG